jgi:outer membrane protein
MKKILFSAMIIIMIYSPVYCVEKKEWNLEALVQNALEKRDDISAQKEKINMAGAKVKEAFSHYFPRIRFASAYTKAESEIEMDLSDYNTNTQITVLGVTYPVNSPLPDNITLLEDEYGSISVTMDQPLFTWGKVTNYANAAEKLKEYEITKKKETENEAVYQVRKSYYSFLVARQAHKFSSKLLQEIKIVNRLIAKEIENNRNRNTSKPSQLDAMETQGFLLYAEGLKLEAMNMEHLALKYLSFSACLEEIPGPSDITGTPDINLIFKAKEDYINKGLIKNPILESLTIGIKAQNHLYKAQKASRLPALGLRFFYDKVSNNSAIDPEDYYGASLIMEGPIFDSGEIKAKANQHLFKKKELEAKKKFAEKKIETAVSVLFDEIMSLKKQIEIDSEALKLMKKRLKLALFGMKEKMASYRDYKDAFIMRNMVQKEYFEKLAAYFDKVNLMVKTIGDRRL